MNSLSKVVVGFLVGITLSATAQKLSAQATPQVAQVGQASNEVLVTKTATVHVKLTHVKFTDKPIFIGFFKKGDVFPFAGFQSIKFQFTPTKNGEVDVTIPNIIPGEYAIALFQDLNENGRLEIGPTGLPKEPVGVLKHNVVSAGIPTFEDSKMDFMEGVHQITIEMIDRAPFIYRMSRFVTAAVLGIG